MLGIRPVLFIETSAAERGVRVPVCDVCGPLMVAVPVADGYACAHMDEGMNRGARVAFCVRV